MSMIATKKWLLHRHPHTSTGRPKQNRWKKKCAQRWVGERNHNRKERNKTDQEQNTKNAPESIYRWIIFSNLYIDFKFISFYLNYFSLAKIYCNKDNNKKKKVYVYTNSMDRRLRRLNHFDLLERNFFHSFQVSEFYSLCFHFPFGTRQFSSHFVFNF